MGRPTDYKEEYNELAYKYCLLGATDADLANFFDVTETTINNWKIDYPSFFESIKRGKFIADANVAERLYQRAMGFEHDSEEIKVINDSIERVPIRKIYPPDATSAIFWLKNRAPKDWRDKQENAITFESPIFNGIDLDVPEDNSASQDSKTKEKG